MKKKLVAFLLIMMSAIGCIFGFSACDNETADAPHKGNVVPSYQGMTIARELPAAATQTKALSATAYISETETVDDDKAEAVENGEFTEETDEEISEPMDDLVDIEVKGDDEVKYYVLPNETFIVQIHLSNPSDYEIQSFTLNGKKYANYMFKEGSTMELLLLEVVAPAQSGYTEYTIDAIKYIDGTEIKDVRMDGSSTIKAGIAYTSQPIAAVTEQKVNTTSIELAVEITDDNKLIGDEPVIIYLSDGENVIDKKELTLGKNEVEFDNLYMGKSYKYGVATQYDLADGKEMQVHWLVENAFTTLKAITFTKQTTIRQDKIDFVLEKVGAAGDITAIRLMEKDGTEVQSLQDLEQRRFENLLSNHEYKLEVAFTYTVHEKTETDSAVISFRTLAKTAPTVQIESMTSTQTAIGYAVNTTDPDGLLTITKIELYKDNALVKTADSVTAIEFTDLLSNNEYTVKATYTYDLNDGAGVHTQTVSASKTTVAKIAPTVQIENMTSTQTAIGYEVNSTDPDGLLTITKIELYKGNALVKTADSITTREFTDLLSNNEYTVTATYTYDLNDGAGVHTQTANASKKTVAKTAPTVTMQLKGIGEDFADVTASISDIDDLYQAKSTILYKGNEKIAEHNNGEQLHFGSLSYYTNYTVKITYNYDLNDGIGVQEKVQSFDFTTNPHFAFTDCEIINTSAVSEGDTIYMQAYIDNPFKATYSRVTINGVEYDVNKSSTVNFMYVEIVSNGQFAGGDTMLTIEKVTVTLDGKEYIIQPQENNSDNVFVNGTLTVKGVELVNDKYESVDSGVVGCDYYFKLTLNNPTGYTVYQAKINDTLINSAVGSGNTFYIPYNLSFGVMNVRFNSFSYRNEYLDKEITLNTDLIMVGYENTTPIEITTAEDLLNMNNDKNYVLKNDIDLSDYQWQGNSFSGVFDGNGHTIKNMRVVTTLDSEEIRLGLFASASGIIKNLNFDRVTYFVTASNENARFYYGTVAARAENLILKNCHITNSSVSISVTASGNDQYIGGMIGYGSSFSINSCSNGANITISIPEKNYRNRVGGFVGEINSYGTVLDCTNSGNISGFYYVGGIAGYSYGAIINCTNSGTVSGKNYVGGIAGDAYGGEGDALILNCTNSGSVTGENYIGGIAGNGGIIMDCLNSGSITGKEEVGGIVGMVCSDSTVANCTNSGTISGDDRIGGIAGINTGTITDCTNEGDITGKWNVEGIAGDTNPDTVTNCTNTGEVIIKNEN